MQQKQALIRTIGNVAGAITLAVLGSGSYMYYRVHGSALVLVILLLAVMLAIQFVFLRITRFHTVEATAQHFIESGPQSARLKAQGLAMLRNLFPLLFGIALWWNALSSNLYQGVDAVLIVFAALGLLMLLAVIAGVLAILVTLVTGKLR